MYTSFYNLDSKPFDISPDPSFLWLGEKQTQDFTTLRYGILENKGFLLVTGPEGTGKTVLLKGFVDSLEEDILWAVMDDPRLERIDFYNAIAGGFGLERQFTSKVQFLIQFSHFLHKAEDENKKVLLVVDDCHLLSQEMLEELRLLANIEKAGTKLINIFLVGRPEFNDLLGQEQNRAVRQRLTQIIETRGLDGHETEDYIRHRMRVAGTEEKLFTARAVQTVQRFAQGMPRRINGICHHALTVGAERARNTIDNKLIEAAVSTMDQSTLELPGIDEIPQEEDLIFNPFKGKLLTGNGQVSPPLSGFNLEKDHQRNWLKYGSGLLLLCVVVVYLWFPETQTLESGQQVAALPVPERKVPPKMVAPVTTSPAVTVLEESVSEMNESKAAELKTAILAKAYGDEDGITTKEEQPGQELGQQPDMPPGPDQKPQDPELAAPAVLDPNPPAIEKAEAVPVVVATPDLPEKIDVSPKEKPVPSESRAEPTVEVASDATAEIPIVGEEPPVVSLSAPAAPKALMARTVPKVPLEPKKVIVRLLPSSLKLTRAGNKELKNFVEKLLLYPNATVFVKGYVSAKTNSPENIKLSRERALIVQEMMQEKGVDPEQIEIVGMGNQEPIASNNTREGRRLNRRVEIEVISDGM